MNKVDGKNMRGPSWATEFMGIQFAPLFVPWERRMQTFAAMFWFSLPLCGLLINPGILLYVIFMSRFWYLGLAYAAWIYYDRETPNTGGRRLESQRRLKIWRDFRDYFPIKMIKTADLPADKRYLICAYPHGILSAGVTLNFQTDANNFNDLFPGIRTYLCALNQNFKLPYYREILLAIGGVSCSEKSLMHVLRGPPGSAAVLMVGGAAEALESYPGTYKIILNNRRGFVRVALKTGASLVPVFSFGENDMYDQARGIWLEKFQDWVRHLVGFAPCLVKGRGFFQYSFGLVPKRRPITTVVGIPIDVPKVDEPSKELLDEYHQKYVEALQKLFVDYRNKYDERGDKANLIIT